MFPDFRGTLLGAQIRSNFTGSRALGDSGASRVFLEVLVILVFLDVFGHFGLGEPKYGVLTKYGDLTKVP